MTMDVTKEIADSNAPVLAANASDTAVPPAVQKDTSTVSEDDESFNDGPGAPCEGEESAVQGVEVPKPANTEPSLTAPTATDFPRVTTRYMIAGREWTRTNRNLALEALGRAVVEWSGLFQLTLWIWNGYKPKGGTPDKPGSGKDFKTTIERYGKWLADKANRVRPKGQLASVTLGGSRYGGSFDDECTARTGIFLDSDDNGGWNEVRALSRSVGLAFVAQMRPAKPESHHFEVPVAKPWLPERDANGNVGDWKLKVYRPQLGWIMGVFSELAELRSDLAWEGGLPTAVHSGYDTACDRLLQLNFLYHLRPDDPPALVPVTDWASGGALDVEMLLSLTGFEAARERLERTGGSVANASSSRLAPDKKQSDVKVRKNVPGFEEIEPEGFSPTTCISMVALKVRLHRLTSAVSRKLVGPLLIGQSYAPLGERNTTMWRIACILAYLAPNGDPSQLADVFRKSLATMAKQPGAEPTVGYVEFMLAHAANMIARAQRNAGGAAR